MGTQTNKQPNSSQLQDNESSSSQPQQLHTHNHHKAAQRNILEMGAVVSCIKSLFQTIGACIMAVVNGIAGMLKAIVSFFGIIVSCLTCGRGGGRRRGGHTTSHV